MTSMRSNIEFRILPYRQGSKSAKSLAEALGGKVLKLEGSKWRPRRDAFVINWGSTTIDAMGDVVLPSRQNAPMLQLLNKPDIVRRASNKLNFFKLMKEGYSDFIPAFWTARSEIPSDAYPVVCRTKLASHSGEGIVIADNAEQLVDAPLYVKYAKKKEEYRIHVGRSYAEEPGYPQTTCTISVQRKARRSSVADGDVNWKVRNLSGGFVYVREGVVPPEPVVRAAHIALGATSLDFGAVDVIWNDKEQKAYVLEVNTAPGLEGQTVNDYAEYFTS